MCVIHSVYQSMWSRDGMDNLLQTDVKPLLLTTLPGVEVKTRRDSFRQLLNIA